MLSRKFGFVDSHIFRISQKKQTGNEKLVFQGEGIEKVVVQLLYVGVCRE